MSNPNNCATCDYKKLNANREKGHCYMFCDEPTDICMQHTGRGRIGIELLPLKKARVPNLKLSERE